MRFKATYHLNDSGNYHVTLKLLYNKVIVGENTFRKVTGYGLPGYAQEGSLIVDLQQALDMGFEDPGFWDLFTRKEQPADDLPDPEE